MQEEINFDDEFDFDAFCENYRTIFLQNEGVIRSGPRCYPEDEVARMGRRCLLLDAPSIKQLIEREWRFDTTISQFVVYL